MRRIAWLMMLGLLAPSCTGGGSGVPEITGPLQLSASAVQSCQTLTVTVPVTRDTYYVQLSLDGPAGFDGIDGVFNKSGATEVTIPFRVAIEPGAQPEDISVYRVLLQSAESGDETNRSEYVASATGDVFDVKQCKPYVSEVTSKGTHTTCAVHYEGPSTIAVPAPVTVTSDPGCKQYYLETFPNASSLPADQRPEAWLSVEVWDDAMNSIAAEQYSESYIKLKPQLKSGEPCSIEVSNSIATWGGYSIRLSATGFGGSSSASPATPDAYEPDDTAAEAKPIELDVVQDRTLRYDAGVGDRDWLEFTAP
jgi:hypothetical protein